MNSVRAGDWTAVRAILASSVNSVRAGDWTAVRAILASSVNSSVPWAR